jgi:hypothetical protein
MSAQPDDALEPILAHPIRLALWRESTTARGVGLIPLADAFLTEANANGGTFTPRTAWQLVHALTATQGALGTLPRWVAEAFAEVLHLDPSDLRPEGAPPPLRAVPHTERKPACPTPKPSHPSASRSSVTPAGKVSATSATEGAANATTRFTTKFQVVTNPQGTHDESPSAGVADSMVPPAVAPPASPAASVDKCPLVYRDDPQIARSALRGNVSRPTMLGGRGEEPVENRDSGNGRSKRFPCREPGCRGGSNDHAWGRDIHEVIVHGTVLGPPADPPPAALRMARKLRQVWP